MNERATDWRFWSVIVIVIVQGFLPMVAARFGWPESATGGVNLALTSIAARLGMTMPSPAEILAHRNAL